MAKDMKLMKGRVLRFGKVAIFAHWAHTVCFFLLALTGWIIFANSLVFLSQLFGGMQGVRIVHRVAAVGFIALPVVSLMANFKGFVQWMADVTNWSSNDTGFLMRFLKEFFGIHVEMPPQGRFNGGEKINSLLQVTGCTILGITGLVIWLKQLFPVALVRYAIPLHDLAFVLTFTAALGHIYMALGLPSAKGAINGMLSGYVDAKFARSHYPLWYKEVQEEKAN